MRIIGLWTPSHEQLKNEWFLPTIPKEFEVSLEFLPNDSDGLYLSSLWSKSVEAKCSLIIEYAKANMDSLFVYADCDIQFFNLSPSLLKEVLGNCDIAFQQDDRLANACTGFFVARASQSFIRLWQEVAHYIKIEGRDQLAMNRLLRRSTSIRWKLLPPIFFGAGCGLPLLPLYKRLSRFDLHAVTAPWKPGVPLALPDGIVMHHANWTIGTVNKHQQLSYVAGIMAGSLC